jgi:hypothetical protein
VRHSGAGGQLWKWLYGKYKHRKRAATRVMGNKKYFSQAYRKSSVGAHTHKEKRRRQRRRQRAKISLEED